MTYTRTRLIQSFFTRPGFAFSQVTFIILLFASFLRSQTSPEDSVLLNQQIQDLIVQKQYASAHLLMQDYLLQVGPKPYYVCWMVENGLQHYFRHQNFQIFYLKDEAIPEQDSSRSIPVARLRYPQRLLNSLLYQHPGYARAYQLLGEYYLIQMEYLTSLEFPDTNRINNLEKLVFKYFTQAEKLNYQSARVNQWLGCYYRRMNQIDLAEKYFLRNIQEPYHDAVSYLNLAEISYQQKKYTSAFNYAMAAVKYFSPVEIYQKYRARRLAARSLLALGDDERFLQNIRQCLQTIPDLQDAYIDLFKYYEDHGMGEQAEKVLKKMLLTNPYDREGYSVLESYILRQKNFYFGDTLFEEMLLKYENWDEVLANIYWSKGNLAYYQGLKSEAEKFWEISRNYMRRYLNQDDPLFKQVGQVSPMPVNK